MRNCPTCGEPPSKCVRAFVEALVPQVDARRVCTGGRVPEDPPRKAGPYRTRQHPGMLGHHIDFMVVDGPTRTAEYHRSCGPVHRDEGES